MPDSADLIARYQDLVRHSADVITLVDDAGCIEYQSPSVERVLGYDQRALVGEPVFGYVHPEDRELVETALVEAAAADPSTVHQAEYRFRHADGSWVPLESTATRRPGPDGGFVVNSRDVTNQRRREARLETLSEELEALNRVVRHDIRNDMTVILGWAELLEDHVDAAGREYLDMILASGEHVVELTANARDYVETLTAGGEVELKPVPLRSVLETELALRREHAPEATFVVDGELPDVAVTANELLVSVFTNLLLNAVQHNPAESPRVVVSATVEGEHAVVEVADDGPGVPDDRKDAVFGKGEKDLDSPGTGIGLYLLRRLVEQYGGAVRVEDNEPVGAVFVVRLPLAE